MAAPETPTPPAPEGRTRDLRIAVYVLAAAVLAVLSGQGFITGATAEAILETVLAAVNLMAVVVTLWQRRNDRARARGPQALRPR